MRKVAKFIVKHYRPIFIAFLVAVLLCGFLAGQVKTNYSLAKYLPKEAASSRALEVMDGEFHESVPNLRMVMEGVSLPQAAGIKEDLGGLDEVSRVMWLDTYVSLNQPLDLVDPTLLDQYYQPNADGKTGTALLQVTVETKNAKDSLAKIKDLANAKGIQAYYDGDLVDQTMSQEATSSEVLLITSLMIPLGVLILLFSTQSWLDPFLLLLTLAVAIVLNLGTNIFFGEVSFITMAVTSILQLAVSMDYVLFLLHAWARNKEAGMDRDQALVEAICESSSSIVSSALTTVFGFLALIFMRYRLGMDLGLVLAKGVAFSLFCVIFFLPTLLILFGKWEEKLSHRSFLPSFKGLSTFVYKKRFILILLVILVPVAFLASRSNRFTYGMGGFPENSQIQKDADFINSKFKPNTQIVLLVPKGDMGRERGLVNDLQDLPMVTSILSYTEMVGEGIPVEVLPGQAIKELMSENYDRIIVNTTSPKEGEEAFALVDQVRSLANEAYGDQAHILGHSVTLKDMKDIIQEDNRLVNLLAILSIAMVIAINFKSLILPILLVLTIELSIWINLSFPYFTNTELTFIGYLIISSIQLGATVDYAILYTNHYLHFREDMPKDQALVQSGMKTYGSIIPPAFILALAGFLLYKFSSLEVVSEIGTVLGRGALLSLFMVIFLLPALLYFFDGLVEKATRGIHFFPGKGLADIKEAGHGPEIKE
ncbi:efflux RND transporter permease subunit [Kallipyga massiliensis]|uniref:efflux RND transporter permease subunit n=1 Tax=Kallipyga massiliensis TaxID=1472764 RepID=UPI0004BCF0F1|nr:MMPL family transporter [Kallipyga massiliensis]